MFPFPSSQEVFCEQPSLIAHIRGTGRGRSVVGHVSVCDRKDINYFWANLEVEAPQWTENVKASAQCMMGYAKVCNRRNIEKLKEK